MKTQFSRSRAWAQYMKQIRFITRWTLIISAVILLITIVGYLFRPSDEVENIVDPIVSLGFCGWLLYASISLFRIRMR